MVLIRAACPAQVYAHATVAFFEGVTGGWSDEEVAKLKRLVARHGRKWTSKIGPALGRLPAACRIKHKDAVDTEEASKGAWSVEEIAALRKAVADQKAVHAAAAPSDDTKLGGLSFIGVDPTVNWTSVGAAVGRAPKKCAAKFRALAPSMKDSGEWAAGDDGRMLEALRRQRAFNVGCVDWGALLPGRPAAVCLKRWRLWTKTVPRASEKGFAGVLAEMWKRHGEKADKRREEEEEEEQEEEEDG